jgi:phage gpG-like protein
MAGATIRIEDDALRAALAGMAGQLGNMQDVMDAIGGRLVNLAKQGFEQEQSPEGTPWKPLAASTILSRARANRWPGPILQMSGKLKGSLNWQATPTTVEIGAGWGDSGPYAAIHQFGGRVLRPMRRGTLRFKVDKDGRSRFATKAKANFEQDATFGGRAFTITARPYLPTSPLPDRYLRSCIEIINQRLGDVIDG